MSDKRYFHFEGASNFRETGGLPVPNGKLKSSIIYRSDELSRLTRNDFQLFKSLGIKLICDLRTPNEIKSKPDNLFENCSTRIVNIPFYHKNWNYNQLQIIWYLVTNSKKIDFEKLIIEHYLNNAFNRRMDVGRVLKLLVDKNNLPMLIHCKAGKDRTGLIAAIIQLLAGVDIERVYDEYILTNILMKEKMELIEKTIRRMSFFRLDPERIKPLLEVRREYLEAVLKKIFDDFGSIENYLVTACCLERGQIEKIKSNICELNLCMNI